MITDFDPSNPRFRRSVMAFSVLACTLAGFHVVMIDYGKQEHVFTPVIFNIFTLFN